MADEKLPIKHVKFSDKDYKKTTPPRGFSPPKFFKEVTSELRSYFSQSIEDIKLDLEGRENFYGVAVVEVEAEAIAKTHRPSDLFNEQTCPFIGDVGFCKFLIQTSAKGLDVLIAKINNPTTKIVDPQVSTIKKIELYEPEIILLDDTKSVNIRLFKFDSQSITNDAICSFKNLLRRLELRYSFIEYENLILFNVDTSSDDVIQELAGHISVAKISSANDLTLTPAVLSGFSNEPISIPAPDPDVEYPIVAVVDSGVNVDCPVLSRWVVGSEQFVVENRDLFHGTFVSGLISNAKALNGGDHRFPYSQSKVFSVEVLDADGGSASATIQAMEEVAQANPGIKVWNLSLGSKCPSSKNVVSELAIWLDAFQSKHNCLCIISAGNYQEKPYRRWPVSIVGLNDGISSPGDSVKGLTVGSIAHVDGFVKTDEPSHFSRRGPVLNYVQKPEVVHYGGNTDIGSTKVLGVNSIGQDCRVGENIGTSFSAPLVSTIAANLYKQIGYKSSHLVVKSLLVHSANLRHAIKGEDRHYYGWGVPGDVDEILSNTENEITIVMEGQARKSFELQKLPFPIADCLRTDEGKVRAEFFITLVYDPPIDPQSAYEYCQVNMTVALGELKEDGSFSGKVPQDYSDYQYEEEQVKNGGKWSPTKVYRKIFPQGVDVRDWKLKLEMMARDGYEPEGVLIPFSLVITVRALDPEAPVYNEMTQLMNNQNWEVSDLVQEQEIRV